MLCQRAELSQQIDVLSAVRSFIASCVAASDSRRENLWVLHFNEHVRCLRITRHSGDESGADFPLRTIIADVAAHGSVGLILAHNHPSGDERPSQADCNATRRLASAAEALDCRILDHWVYGGGKMSSFQQMGLL